MPVPKRKRSRARRDSRFANKGLKPSAVGACAQCQTPLATHRICPTCGFYKGRKVMATKLDRAMKRSEINKVQAERAAKTQKAPSGQAGE